MNLVPNAGKVARHSWSFHLMSLAALLEILSLSAPAILPELERFVSPEQLSIASLVFIAMGIIARFIKQEKVSG